MPKQRSVAYLPASTTNACQNVAASLCWGNAMALKTARLEDSDRPRNRNVFDRDM
jgi:hypothetical protein